MTNGIIKLVIVISLSVILVYILKSKNPPQTKSDNIIVNLLNGINSENFEIKVKDIQFACYEKRYKLLRSELDPHDESVSLIQSNFRSDSMRVCNLSLESNSSHMGESNVRKALSIYLQALMTHKKIDKNDAIFFAHIQMDFLLNSALEYNSITNEASHSHLNEGLELINSARRARLQLFHEETLSNLARFAIRKKLEAEMQDIVDSRLPDNLINEYKLAYDNVTIYYGIKKSTLEE